MYFLDIIIYVPRHICPSYWNNFTILILKEDKKVRNDIWEVDNFLFDDLNTSLFEVFVWIFYPQVTHFRAKVQQCKEALKKMQGLGTSDVEQEKTLKHLQKELQQKR